MINKNKINDLIKIANNNKIDITAIQETHDLGIETEKIGNYMLIKTPAASEGNRITGGTAFLIHKKYDGHIQNIKKFGLIV